MASLPLQCSCKQSSSQLLLWTINYNEIVVKETLKMCIKFKGIMMFTTNQEFTLECLCNLLKVYTQVNIVAY